jgi:hypothetical protein
MGGNLQQAPSGKSPTFLVAALKDPIGANLDRLQVVKGWLDSKGDVQEKVYDVAWSGSRKAGADGKLPAVGNTVDMKAATNTKFYEGLLKRYSVSIEVPPPPVEAKAASSSSRP